MTVFSLTPPLLQILLENYPCSASGHKLISEGSVLNDFCDRCKMEVYYKIFSVSDLKALAKDRSLWGYSRLRNADLISLLRSHDASTRKSAEGAKSNLEESDNEDELYPMITTQKQFDPEESNK